MDIWFQCTECIFATNSPKAAAKHYNDTDHEVPADKGEGSETHST